LSLHVGKADRPALLGQLLIDLRNHHRDAISRATEGDGEVLSGDAGGASADQVQDVLALYFAAASKPLDE
jgi:hypothetical protein